MRITAFANNAQTVRFLKALRRDVYVHEVEKGSKIISKEFEVHHSTLNGAACEHVASLLSCQGMNKNDCSMIKVCKEDTRNTSGEH